MSKENHHLDIEEGRDQEVLTKLMGLRYELNHFIFSAIPNRTDAEDIFQEVSLKIWKMRKDYQPGSQFRAWAFTITRYTILDWRKRYATRRVQYLDHETIELLADELEEMHEESDQKLATNRALAQCIAELDKRLSKIFQLHYRDQISLSDIARQEASTTTAIKQLFYRTRTKIRKCVNARLNLLNVK